MLTLDETDRTYSDFEWGFSSPRALPRKGAETVLRRSSRLKSCSGGPSDFIDSILNHGGASSP